MRNKTKTICTPCGCMDSSAVVLSCLIDLRAPACSTHPPLHYHTPSASYSTPLSEPHERPRVCIWCLQFLPNPLNASLEHLQFLQRAPCKRCTLRAPTQCHLHLHWREPAHSCVSHYATSQGTCFLFRSISSHRFVYLASGRSARRITPCHSSATSTPKQGGAALTGPFNSRMISAARQSRTTQ